MKRALLTIALAACSSSSPQAEPVRPPAPADAAPEPPPPIDAAPSFAPAAELLTLTIDEPVTGASGIVITLHSRGHKHSARGGTVSRFELELASGGASESVDYSYSSGLWYLEGVAHGYLYTVEMLSDSEWKQVEAAGRDPNRLRRVTLAPTDRVALGDEAFDDAVEALLEPVRERLGCTGTSSTGNAIGAGAYRVDVDGDAGCTLVAGVYTGRVIVVRRPVGADGKLAAQTVRPTAGPPGTVVQIRGTGFAGSTPGMVSAYVGDQPGRVLETTAEHLLLEVPAGSPGQKADIVLVFADQRRLELPDAFEWR